MIQLKYLKPLIAIFALLPLTLALADRASSVQFDYSFQLPAIQKLYPAHYAKITDMLEHIGAVPVDDVPEWIQRNYGASNITFVPARSGNQASRYKLGFSLDDVHYESYIALNHFKSNKIMLHP